MRRRSRGLPQSALVGLIALVVVLGALAAIYATVSFGPGHGGYRVGIHFGRAAGLAPGSQVFLSGVAIGTVHDVRVLPDGTVDVIIAVPANIDIPKDATFSVQTTLTGSPSISIMPAVTRAQLNGSPTPLPREALMERRVLPIEEQPIGHAPLDIEQLMTSGQVLTTRTTAILTGMHGYKHSLLGALQRSRRNAAAASLALHATPSRLKATVESLNSKLQTQTAAAQAALQYHDRSKLASIAGSLDRSRASVDATVHSLQSMQSDSRVRENLQQSATALKNTTATMASLSGQLSRLSSDKQLRAELNDASLQLRAATEKLHSLLKHLPSGEGRR